MGSPYDPTQHQNTPGWQPPPATPGGPGSGPAPQQYPSGPQFSGQQYPAQPQYPGASYSGPQYPNQPYPNQPYPGQPYPGQPNVGAPLGLSNNAQPPKKSGTAWWIVGGVSVVAIIALVIVLVLQPWDSDSDSDKPLPSASASSLLLPQSDFPDQSADFDTGDGSDSDSDVRIDNTKCQELADNDTPGGDKASRSGEKEDDGGTTFATTEYEVKVTKNIDESRLTKIDEMIAACGSFTMYDDSMSLDATLKSVELPGIDGDYRAIEMTGSTTSSGFTVELSAYFVYGVERHVGFQLGYNSVTIGNVSGDSNVREHLVSIFNKQRKVIADAD